MATRRKKASAVATLGLASALLALSAEPANAFVPAGFVRTVATASDVGRTSLFGWSGDNKDEATIEEEARLKICEARRRQIRNTLKAAESLRNYRIGNGLVPELDENGEPVRSDGKLALTATAFVVACGAIALRVGGRAALVSTIGLDFITENQELQSQMNQVLEFSESMDAIAKLALFCLAWTAVKVLCFDAGGVVLALASGVIFGGVLEGAVISAFGATVGSSVAFALAKLDTPVRKKALEIVDDNPSLRGIEKVVARDGLKAILTLRLAPVLPIPIGFYNYVYGVTKVPFLDFAGGIFLGSMKPYLLDSYLGYFGKSLMDGSAAQDGGMQDIILLVALGISVLIGVFASQLASETWDSVLQEIKAEEEEEDGTDKKDSVVRDVFGWELPKWVVGFQLSLKEAEARINSLIEAEVSAKAWNYTKADGDNPVPESIDPSKNPDSPEIVGAYKGIDFAASLCEGLVLSPCLLGAFLTLADPLYDEEKFERERAEAAAERAVLKPATGTGDPDRSTLMASPKPNGSASTESDGSVPTGDAPTRESLLALIEEIRLEAEQSLEQLNRQQRLREQQHRQQQQQPDDVDSETENQGSTGV